MNLEVWPRIRGELLATFHKLPEGRRGSGRMLGGDRNSAAATLQKQLKEMEPRKETQIGAKLGRLGNQPGHRHLDQWLGPNLNQNLNHFLSYLCGLSMLKYR